MILESLAGGGHIKKRMLIGIVLERPKKQLRKPRVMVSQRRKKELWDGKK